jgi:hypothetical protein
MSVQLFPRAMAYTQARKHIRRQADFSVRFSGSGYQRQLQVLNVSAGGIGLLTDEPPHPMTLVELTVELPEGPVDALARVMWVEGNSVGMRFERVDPRLLTAVEGLPALG